MNIYDSTGTPIQLSTCKEVYVKSSEGKVVKSFTPTFRSFYDRLSAKELERLWYLALINLGLDDEIGYCDIEPHSIEFVVQEITKVEPTIWRYLMVAVGYPKSKVMRLKYDAFADTQGLLGFERIMTNKGEVEQEAFEYLLSIRPKERVNGCMYHKLGLQGCKYITLSLDDKKLPILIYANNPEDTNPFFNEYSTKLVINQPAGFLANQFRITEGDLEYDVAYNKPANANKKKGK